MKLFVSQVYIEPGVSFPFTLKFQVFLSRQLTDLVVPSSGFTERFGEDYDLMFRMSAKQGLSEPEIKGPTVFKRDRDVEFTVFLPFQKHQAADRTALRDALNYLFAAICKALRELALDTTKLAEEATQIIDAVIEDAQMTESNPR